MSTALQEEPGVVAEVASGRRLGAFVRQVVRAQPAAVAGALVLGVLVVIAVFAPVIAPYGLHQRVGPVFGAPSAHHWLGLDDGGIDMVTLLMWGARISLLVGFAATIVSMLLGGAIGVTAGYFGGATDVVNLVGAEELRLRG